MSSNIHSASHEEILEKALKRAINNGLTGYWKDRYESCVHLDELEYLFHENDESDPRFLIFNHDFAKALWGEAAMTVEEGCAYSSVEENVEISQYWRKHFLNSWNWDMPMWAYHLTRMVIADDPIKYLGDNI